MIKKYAHLQLSLKALITKDGKILVLHTPAGYVDFPGGRMDQDEINEHNESILRRELLEELGLGVEFAIYEILFTTKRHYTANNTDQNVVALFYRVEITKGSAIRTSDEHTRYEWVLPEELLVRKASFMSEDEYDQIVKYYSDRDI